MDVYKCISTNSIRTDDDNARKWYKEEKGKEVLNWKILINKIHGYNRKTDIHTSK